MLAIDFAGQGSQKTGTTVAMDFGRLTLGPRLVARDRFRNRRGGPLRTHTEGRRTRRIGRRRSRGIRRRRPLGRHQPARRR